jgi:hypothetical protein
MGTAHFPRDLLIYKLLTCSLTRTTAKVLLTKSSSVVDNQTSGSANTGPVLVRKVVQFLSTLQHYLLVTPTVLLTKCCNVVDNRTSKYL